MTLAAAWLDGRRPLPALGAVRRVFPVDRSTAVLGHESGPDSARATAVVLHGLTGEAETPYARAMAAKLGAAGLRVLRLDARGLGESAHLSPGLYHVGLSSDVRAVVERLEAEGRRRIYLVGFSMGANVALKLAGELGAEGKDGPLAGVVAISPPIVLAQAAFALAHGIVNQVYELHFVRGLRSTIVERATRSPGVFELSRLRGAHSLRRIDDRFVAPSFGFRDADDYYRRAAAWPWLEHIRVPTLVVHAADDPMIPFAPFRRWAAHAPPHVQLLLPRHGGHVGFVARAATPTALDPDRWWAENRAVQFVREHEARAGGTGS